MDLILSTRTRSFMARAASGGAEVLSPPQESESDLDNLLSWLREKTRHHWTVDTSTDEVVISHWNDAELEAIRTTITCDQDDRPQLIAALHELLPA